jgi:phosphate-selective porin OprO/OprP
VPYVQNFTLGYLKSPFGIETMTRFGDQTFMEPASPIQAFTPGNRSGMQVDGNWRDQRMAYQFGFFALGQDTSFNFGDASEGQLRAIGRLSGLPIYEDTTNAFRLLHLGMALSHVFSDKSVIRYQSRPESHLAPFLVDTQDIPARNASQLGLESAYARGRLSLQGELLGSWVTDAPSGDLFFWGGYAYASWFLTGEHRAYDRTFGAFGRPDLGEGLKPLHGLWGAFELGMRYSYLDLTDGAVKGGRMHMFMSGVNWYWGRHMRVQFNYGWSIVQGGALPGDLHSFQGRLQFHY